MKLPNSLLREFAAITNAGSTKKRGTETTVYGTVTSSDANGVMVRFDGSTVNTPVVSSVSVNVGDRVTVMLKNHRAILNGNVSSPAASKQDTQEFVRYVDGGIVLGGIDKQGNPTSLYLTATGNSFTIKDTNGNLLYEFEASQASFVSGNVLVKFIQNVSYLMGRTAIAIKSAFTSGTSTVEATVETNAGGGSPVASLGVSQNGTSLSGVHASSTNLNLFAPDGNVTVNNRRLLLSGKVMAIGSFEANATVPTGSSYSVEVPIEDLPEEYTLSAIKAIDIYEETVVNDETIRTRNNSLALMSYKFTELDISEPSEDPEEEIEPEIVPAVQIVVGNNGLTDVNAFIFAEWLALNCGEVVDYG